ncbi:fatty acid biosynthesis transcriptional regulator FabT [Enterococcus sp. CSURQ0835]|uniref:fatty acid biosynthesis transcriptional regulator FabT n=1 Tax=Enterococcus sp. CSURQ0835 TaxID=2681394 RepID=UPI00135A38C0|nr:MarR family transcriptional regulator [Enterococcus sp. CSURQ0835]
MEHNWEETNDYLVSIFNDVLWIEEKQLKKSQFNDLTMTEMHTIDAIGMYKKKTTTEVARELLVTVGTLTTSINRLVKKGYAERIRSEDDRRVVKLALTKKGRLVYRIHQHFHREMVKRAIQDLNPDEQEVFLRALKNLYEYLEEIK